MPTKMIGWKSRSTSYGIDFIVWGLSDSGALCENSNE
jgi:hypothetical protein